MNEDVVLLSIQRDAALLDVLGGLADSIETLQDEQAELRDALHTVELGLARIQLQLPVGSKEPICAQDSECRIAIPHTHATVDGDTLIVDDYGRRLTA